MVKKPETAAETAAGSSPAPNDPVSGAAVADVTSQTPPVENQDSAPTRQDPGADHGETRPYLTTRASDLGGQGLFRDLTDAELAAAPKGLFAFPTADQLALRRY